jgi:hypothetical protein
MDVHTTLNRLENIAQAATALDLLGLHKEADEMDRMFTRLAYFKGLKGISDMRAQYMGGTNPAYTGNTLNFFNMYQTMSTPCGAIRLPAVVANGSHDAETAAQEVVHAIEMQCPELGANEAAMAAYREDLVEWFANDYALAKQQGLEPATPPKMSDPYYQNMAQPAAQPGR